MYHWVRCRRILLHSFCILILKCLGDVVDFCLKKGVFVCLFCMFARVLVLSVYFLMYFFCVKWHLRKTCRTEPKESSSGVFTEKCLGLPSKYNFRLLAAWRNLGYADTRLRRLLYYETIRRMKYQGSQQAIDHAQRCPSKPRFQAGLNDVVGQRNHC